MYKLVHILWGRLISEKKVESFCNALWPSTAARSDHEVTTMTIQRS
jgi:hypothetical protein